MIRLRSRSELQTWRKSVSSDEKIGFVPTMGALHEGHLSLIREAKKTNDIVAVSIFVNRLQFNDPEDFAKYPQTLERDFELLKTVGVEVVWTPEESDLYPYGTSLRVVENELSKKLCGASRPGHFDGVLTVVMKLFQLVRPHQAFFGEKDYQQLQLIKKMVDEFFLDVQIVPVETLREKSGLAMSSRNLRLTPREKEIAPLLFQIIKDSKEPQEALRRLEENSFKVDYVEDIKNRRFAAAWLGNVRLIDNVKI